MLKIPSTLSSDTPDNVFYPYIELLADSMLAPLLGANDSRLQLVDVLMEAAADQQQREKKVHAVEEFPLLSKEFDHAARDFAEAIKQHRSKPQISALYCELYNVYTQWCRNSCELERISWEMWVMELKKLKRELEQMGNVRDEQVQMELVDRINRFFTTLGSSIKVEAFCPDDCLHKSVESLIGQLKHQRPEYLHVSASSASKVRKHSYRWKRMFKR